MATTGFAEWVKGRRLQLGLSQSELARRVAKKLGREYTRDRVWHLELGTPAYPEPDLVAAFAASLKCAVDEPLRAMGYLNGEDAAKKSGPEEFELEALVRAMPPEWKRALLALWPVAEAMAEKMVAAEARGERRVAEERVSLEVSHAEPDTDM